MAASSRCLTRGNPGFSRRLSAMNVSPILGWLLIRNILAIRGIGIPQRGIRRVEILAARPFTDGAVGSSPDEAPENTKHAKFVEHSYTQRFFERGCGYDKVLQ